MFLHCPWRKSVLTLLDLFWLVLIWFLCTRQKGQCAGLLATPSENCRTRKFGLVMEYFAFVVHFCVCIRTIKTKAQSRFPSRQNDRGTHTHRSVWTNWSENMRKYLSVMYWHQNKRNNHTKKNSQMFDLQFFRRCVQSITSTYRTDSCLKSSISVCVPERKASLLFPASR